MATRAQASKALGEAIREIRREQKLAQERAALACKIDRAYFGAIERGERNPSFLTLLKLARGLGTSAATIVSRAERRLR